VRIIFLKIKLENVPENLTKINFFLLFYTTLLCQGRYDPTPDSKEKVMRKTLKSQAQLHILGYFLNKNRYLYTGNETVKKGKGLFALYPTFSF